MDQVRGMLKHVLLHGWVIPWVHEGVCVRACIWFPKDSMGGENQCHCTFCTSNTQKVALHMGQEACEDIHPSGLC